MSLTRKLRYGMVGGGPGAFIGAVHRRAAELDGLAEIVAGAFSSDPAKSKAQGEALHLDPSRVYGSYEEMAAAEAARPLGDRIDVALIVTPNHVHFPAAKAFIAENCDDDDPAVAAKIEARRQWIADLESASDVRLDAIARIHAIMAEHSLTIDDLA